MAKTTRKPTDAKDTGLSLLRVLTVLLKYSSPEHPLTQEKIVDYLKKDYNITLDRRAVSRKVKMLAKSVAQDEVIILKQDPIGTWVNQRPFWDGELKLLIDSVMFNRYASKEDTDAIVEKIYKLGGVHFAQNVASKVSAKPTLSAWEAAQNSELMYCIEDISKAIKNKQAISFDFGYYWEDKKLHDSVTHCISPYALVMHNQRYYLVGYETKADNPKRKSDGISSYRLNHIKNVQVAPDATYVPLDNVNGGKNTLDYKKLIAQPYFFLEEQKHMEFVAPRSFADVAFESFGENLTSITPLSQSNPYYAKFCVRASEEVMKIFALSYCNKIKVTHPESVRDAVYAELTKAVKKYEGEYTKHGITPPQKTKSDSAKSKSANPATSITPEAPASIPTV